MSAPGGDLFTAEERGQSSRASRNAGRLVVSTGVAALVIGVILAGNFLSVGTFLPWVTTTAEPDTVLADVPGEAVDAALAALDRDQAPLVAAEDVRLATVAALAADDPRLAGEFQTVVLPARPEGPVAYGLGDLLATGALRQDDATTYTLLRHVVVRNGAELAINAPGATIRLTSSPTGSVSIVGWGGSIGFIGAEGAPLTLVGWDAEAGAPDTDTTDGRAYIRARDAGLVATDARFENLGYWSGRTGGLSVTATGFGFAALALQRTAHVGLHYGLFTSALTGGTVSGATITGSAMAGIEATNGSGALLIENTVVEGSGAAGLLIDRASSGITVQGSTFTGSGTYGIRADGAPLADGPSAGGYLTTPAANLKIIDSTLRANGAGGMWITSIDDTVIQGTTIDAIPTALRLEGPATNVSIDGGSFTSRDHRGLSVGKGVTGLDVSGTAIAGPRIAVEVRDSDADISGAALTVDVGHVVELADGARADVVGSTFVGTGQDAVVSLSGARSVVRDNNASGWRFQPEFVAWMNEHPMMWMWALVLIVPVVGLPLLARRRRKHRELRGLLEDAIVRYGASQIERYGTDGAPEPVAAAPEPVAPAPEPVIVPRQPGTARRPAAAARPGRPPRSFADLRAGALEGREFATLQQFAVAAVLEAGYPLSAIASLFRVPSWKLQTWVQETIENPDALAPAPERPSPRTPWRAPTR